MGWGSSELPNSPGLVPGLFAFLGVWYLAEMAEIHRSDETWFSRELLGRWRVLPVTGSRREFFGDQDLHLAAELAEITAEAGLLGEPSFVCAECRHVVTAENRDGTRRWRHSAWDEGYQGAQPTDWKTMVEALGDHFHNEDSSADQLRFYEFHGVGPWKSEMTGSWIDLVSTAFPYLFHGEPGPVLPRSVLDHEVRFLRADSGRVEFPNRRITDAEYMALRGELIERHGFIDVENRMSLDYLKFFIWQSGWKDGNAYAAAEGETT